MNINIAQFGYMENDATVFNEYTLFYYTHISKILVKY